MTPVIETRGLVKRYGRKTALSDCTMSVPAGHVVGLVGPNGAGKTTLLQLDQMTIMVQEPPVGSWVIADENVDASGQLVPLRTPDACLQESLDACAAYVLPLHLSERLSYQPADRFWTFQAYEAGIFLALSAVLVGLTTWRVRRIG